MNEIKPFRPLQAPVAIALSAFAIIALAELHSLNPESDSFPSNSFAALTAIVFWIISAGVAAYNSPQAQGATSAVFTVAALMDELMPADSEQKRSVLSQISPILWILAGIMCGSAAATCTTISRTSKHHITFLCGFVMTAFAGLSPFIPPIYLVVTLIRYYTFDNAEAAGTYLADILPIPLLAISATAGLLTMYHYKKPRPITSSQSTESHTSPHQEDTHE